MSGFVTERNDMDHRIKIEKFNQEPHYYYSEFEECVMRSELIEGEIVYFIKFRGAREFKAIYSSKLVGNILSGSPEPISEEEYYAF